jgi:cellulose synthase/poly-beta-1,6-N-acetylglucosamine synthase-like glycosyltransferase
MSSFEELRSGWDQCLTVVESRLTEPLDKRRNIMSHVTIVICNYNYDQYLAAAIDSALAQDYPETAVMVIDDGSTDGSQAVIEKFGTRVSSIFKKNGGQVTRRSTCLKRNTRFFSIPTMFCTRAPFPK